MDNPNQPSDLKDVEALALNLVELIGRTIGASPSRNVTNSSGRGNSSAAHPLPTAAAAATPPPAAPLPNTSGIQVEMARLFPGHFGRGGPRPKRGQKRFAHPPKPRMVKSVKLSVVALPRPSNKTPNASTDLKMMRAGLGKRCALIPEDADHSEIRAIFEMEFPKLESLNRDWLFYKATGGSGQRNLTVITPELEGYTGTQLKNVCSGGKMTLYIVPQQGHLDDSPLPFNATQFSKMLKSTCRKCGQSMPLQLLGIHLEECRDYNAESDEFGDTDTDEVLLVSSSKETVVETNCPICSSTVPAEFLEIHASTCGESNHPAETANQGSEESLYGQADHGNEDCVAGPSQIYTMAPDAAWKTVADPQRATEVFRRNLFGQREEMALLRLSIDIREDVDKQEMAIISFYKSRQTKWSRPLRWTLERDVATGDGVTRHLFSLIMKNLQHGFHINFGNSNATLLFDGQQDHLIPSTSQILVESDLFLMAGRMMEHSFIHGGPCLSGLCPAVIHVLLGGNMDTATIQLEDIADLDIRQTVGLIMYLGTSNDNCSSTTLAFFRESVQQFGYPLRVRADHGVENFGVAEFMLTVRGPNSGSFISGKSVHNQRIKRLWRDVWMAVTSIFYIVLHSLEDEGHLDPSNSTHLFCCHYVFLPRLQHSLKVFRDGWDNHPLRTEQNMTPNQMWAMGELHNPIHDPDDVERLKIPYIDWEASGHLREEHSGIVVPVTRSPLSDQQMEHLNANIDPMLLSDSFGKDIYLNTLQLVLFTTGN